MDADIRYSIEKVKTKKKMRAACIIIQLICSLAAKLRPEIGKSTRSWFSTYDKSQSQSAYKWTTHCLVCCEALEQCFSVFGTVICQYVISQINRCTLSYYCHFYGWHCNTLPVYANSVADEPILLKQTMFIPVRKWSSVLMRSDLLYWTTFPLIMGMTSAYSNFKCVCAASYTHYITLFVCRQVTKLPLLWNNRHKLSSATYSCSIFKSWRTFVFFMQKSDARARTRFGTK